MEFDNPQERFIALGWLAAFIDSEGTLTISKSNRRKNGKYNLHPYFSATVSDLRMAERCVDILNRLGIGCYLYHKTTESGNYHIVHCGGFQRMGKMLNVITHFLIEKKERAEWIQKYISGRVNLPKNAPYTDEDLEIQKKVAQLNVKPKYR